MIVIEKKENLKTVSFHVKKLEKEQIKSKANRWREIKEQKIMKSRRKKKRKKIKKIKETSIIKIRTEGVIITIDFESTQEYYEQF